MESIYNQIKTEKIEASGTRAPEAAAAAASSTAAEPAATSDAQPAPAAQPSAAESKLATKLNPDDCQTWSKHAEKIFMQHARLLTLPSTRAALQAEIASHELGRASGDPSGLVMIIMDVKLACEAATAPNLRMPPFKQANYEHMAQAVLAARYRGSSDKDPTLNPGDLVVLLDGGRPGP